MHSIDYGAFIRAQAAPVAAAALHHADEQREQPVTVLASSAAGSGALSSAVAEEVVPVKIDVDKQRPKIDGAGPEKKPKMGGGAAAKGSSQKRNK